MQNFLNEVAQLLQSKKLKILSLLLLFFAACGFGRHRVALLSLDRGNYPERFQTQTEAGGREKKLKGGKLKRGAKETDRELCC